MKRGALGLAAAATLAVWWASMAAGRSGEADRVFVGGRIWTGDPAHPAAEALAVRDTTILAVGKNSSIRALAGKGTEVVNLRGRRVVPGFIDAHLHLLDGGFALEELRLDDDFTFSAVAAHVQRWAAAHPKNTWVTGEGWAYSAFPGGLPTRVQLDVLVPDRPAFLRSYDGHTGWANSAALRVAGITRGMKDPPGGTIVRDAAGEPAGSLKEGAMSLVERLTPKPQPFEIERAWKRAVAQVAAWGITGAQEAGIDEKELPVLASVLEQDPWLRVYAALPMERNPTPEVLARQDALRQRYSSGLLRVTSVKGYVDGVVEAHTAAMFDPYPGDGTGLPNYTQEELDRVVAAYDAAGWQVLLHAIGDRAIDMALTAFEHAARANGTRGRRHRVEHVEVPRLADLRRFPAAGVIASTQAMFPYPNENHLGVYVPTLGPERAKRALAFRSIDDAGAVQAFGSDWPVFTAEVTRGIACAVTRTTIEGTPAGGWEPAQRLTVEAALRHYTRDAAYAVQAETRTGVLARGLAADLVVLSADVLAVPPERIHEVKVLLTVLGGQDTWRAPGL
jgi:predicted amidohydrolase YtcJ